jgi:hypothetical protein
LVGLALAAVVVTVLVAVGRRGEGGTRPGGRQGGHCIRGASIQFRLFAGAVALRVSMAERSGQADRSRCTADLKHTANIPLAVTRSSA